MSLYTHVADMKHKKKKCAALNNYTQRFTHFYLLQRFFNWPEKSEYAFKYDAVYN
jgi:hypothetical protein